MHSIWASKVGQLTCRYIQEQNLWFFLQSSSIQRSTQQFSRQGLDQPGAVQVLIAFFFTSGLFSFKVPGYLPDWLLSDYLKLYNITDQQQEPQLFSKPGKPSDSSPSVSPSSPDFGHFPSTLQDYGNRLPLNHLLGLSNLYYIDPEDQEIR